MPSGPSDSRTGGSLLARGVASAARASARVLPPAPPGETTTASRLEALARGGAPLRRVMAQLAGRLVALRGWERLGFARLRDYAVERFGVSARRLQELARMDAKLRALPALEARFLSGELSWTQARLVARVATPEDEARWIAHASSTTARALAREVRAVDVGALEAAADALDEDGSDDEPREGVRIRCAPRVQGKLFRARQLAHRVAGEPLPVWACLEAVAAEVASAIPVAYEARDEASDGPAPGRTLSESRSARQGRRCGEMAEALPDGCPPGERGVSAPDEDDRQVPASPDGPCAGRAAPRARPHACRGSPESPEVGAAGSLPPFLRSLVAGLEAADAFSLDARLRRALALEQQLEARLAPLLLAFAEARAHRDAGYHSFEGYVRERLGCSPRRARALLRLGRAARSSSLLREAHRSGRLSWVKAHALVPVALSEGAPLGAWVSWAERVTVRRLEEDVDAALVAQASRPGAPLTGPPFAEGLGGTCPEGRQTGAPPTVRGDTQSGADSPPAGRQTGASCTVPSASPTHRVPETRRIFFSAPRPAARFFRAVLCSVRRRIEQLTGGLPSEGEALEAMLDHAVESWGHPWAKVRREHRVFERDGWRCTVPGCSSYRNLHDHHVVFRSAGGCDDLANRTTLCAWHHLRGVHAGTVLCRGSAPGRLRFALGVRSNRPPLLVYRSGDLVV